MSSCYISGMGKLVGGKLNVLLPSRHVSENKESNMRTINKMMSEEVRGRIFAYYRLH